MSGWFHASVCRQTEHFSGVSFEQLTEWLVRIERVDRGPSFEELCRLEELAR